MIKTEEVWNLIISIERGLVLPRKWAVGATLDKMVLASTDNMWRVLSPRDQAVLWHQLGVLHINPIPILSTWRERHIP